MPEADGEVAYTEQVFPPFASFAAGWTMTLTYLIVCPYEAAAIGKISASLIPQLNAWPLYAIGGKTVFLPRCR